MKILIVSALFPPDIAPPAQYTKELATRLATTNAVEVLHYGSRPEKIEGVLMHAVNKYSAAPLRALILTVQLLRFGWQVDKILITNGPSVELPALVASVLYKNKMTLICNDVPALNRSLASSLQRRIHTYLTSLIANTISDIEHKLLVKPIIHPLLPHPTKELDMYESLWRKHVLIYQESSNTI